MYEKIRRKQAQEDNKELIEEVRAEVEEACKEKIEQHKKQQLAETLELKQQIK